MAKNGKTTALALQANNFQITTLGSPEQLSETIRTNFGEDFDLFALERIRVPSGQTNQWAIPTLDGDVEFKKEITGVIVFYHPARARWETDEISNTPPVCSSMDGQTPIDYATRGVVCANCPYNVWHSTEDGGRKKDCKETRFLYLLQPDAMLPDILVLPPTSIKAFRRYLTKLSRQMIPYNRVITKVTLEIVKKKFVYPEARFAPGPRLSDKDWAYIGPIAEAIKTQYERHRLAPTTPLSGEDLTGGPGADAQ